MCIRDSSGYGLQGTEFQVYGNTSGLYLKSLVSGDNIIFETNNGSSIAERVRIANNGRMGIGNNNPQFMIHTESSGNNGGVRFENSHTTTTVSGNTAAGAFPHNLILSNYSGSGTADNRMVSLGFDIPTTSSHANATIAYQATGSNGVGDLQFWLENGNTSYERARFTAAGQFLVGATSSSGARAIIQQNSSDTNPLDQQTCADSSGLRIQNYSFGVGRYSALSLECANTSSVQSASIIAQSVASGTAPDIIIAQRTSNTANTERLRIASDGEVFIGEGFGATNRSTLLSVSGSYQNPTGVWTQIGVYSSDSYAQDKGGTIGFGGQDGSVAKQQFAAIKGAKVNGTSGNYAGYMAFYTRPDGDVTAERMRLDEAGRIGMGVNPSHGRVHSSPIGFNPFSNTWLSGASYVAAGGYGGGYSILDGSKGWSISGYDSGNDIYIFHHSSTTAGGSGGVYLSLIHI